MSMIKAIGVREALPVNHEDCFVEVELKTPEATGRDLLVRIRGISVNPVDCKQRQMIEGPLKEPRILGWDVCGEIVAVGSDVENFTVGEQVIYAGDITRPGCYAQMQLVDERLVGPKPETITEEEAASLPLTALAAWEALFDRLDVDKTNSRDGKAILIIGGSGGLGSMAVQLARKLTNCTVITTASRAESKEWCLKMGAHHVLDHSKPLPEQMTKIGFETVPYILNCNNNVPYWEAMSEMVSPEGSICLVASTKAKLDLDIFMKKSVRISWELMFTRSIFSTKTMANQGDILSRVSKLVDTGVLTHTKTMSLGEMTTHSLAAAHAQVESGKMIGKLSLGGISD
ncbi:zinc-binding alcohol dehydrogenase family protein [Kiloniella antarctica]|uniref:Zinc-type alcohol dehydrogenase-like protein n=1 Tax=Kiloniella antarctica TaxID=1550907 RepID=A0ABW5BI00_9PROT